MAYVVLIMGGVATTAGPIVAAVLFWFLREGVDSFLRQLSEEAWLPDLLADFLYDAGGAVSIALAGIALILLLKSRPRGPLREAPRGSRRCLSVRRRGTRAAARPCRRAPSTIRSWSPTGCGARSAASAPWTSITSRSRAAPSPPSSGPTGAGKTTLFNLLSGFERPDAGTWSLDGRRLNGLAAHRISRLGMVRTFQLTRVLARLTVLENMAVAAPGQSGERLERATAAPALA